MKYIHQIFGRISAPQASELADRGLDLSTEIREFYQKTFPVLGGEPLIAFEMNEADERWDRVRVRLATWDVSDTVRTEFSSAERNAAAWLAIRPAWHHGYPQPEDDFGFRALTYDLTDYCDQCGIGARQIAPFRMSGEPRWGKRNIVQLNWIFDEYFVQPAVYSALFEPLGVGCWPVHNRRGQSLGTVVQLRFDELVELATAALTPSNCPACSRPKYEVVRRGPWPALHRDTEAQLARSDVWFGSGHSGWRLIVASAALHRAANDLRLRGASFEPVASRPAIT